MYKYEKYSYEEFILRLRSIENKKNDRQLALAMELRPDTLAQMKMRAKIPFESAIGYCEKTGYSLDKLFFDKDFKASDATKAIQCGDVDDRRRLVKLDSYLLIRG